MVYPARDFPSGTVSVMLARAMTDEAQTGLLNRHGEGQVANSLPEGSESTMSATARKSKDKRVRGGSGHTFGPARLLRGTGTTGTALVRVRGVGRTRAGARWWRGQRRTHSGPSTSRAY